MPQKSASRTASEIGSPSAAGKRWSSIRDGKRTTFTSDRPSSARRNRGLPPTIPTSIRLLRDSTATGRRFLSDSGTPGSGVFAAGRRVGGQRFASCRDCASLAPANRPAMAASLQHWPISCRRSRRSRWTPLDRIMIEQSAWPRSPGNCAKQLFSSYRPRKPKAVAEALLTMSASTPPTSFGLATSERRQPHSSLARVACGGSKPGSRVRFIVSFGYYSYSRHPARHRWKNEKRPVGRISPPHGPWVFWGSSCRR